MLHGCCAGCCHLNCAGVDVIGYEVSPHALCLCAFCAASCKWYNDKVAFAAHCFDE